jgi:prepilin-type N-terminal cleavage/methylation domain-containing protein
MKKYPKGFTLLELILVLAVFVFLASVIFALLSNTWRDSRDAKRVENLTTLTAALQNYQKDHGEFPKETEGANGNVVGNAVLSRLLQAYLPTLPTDPAGSEHQTFFYYYDGAHQCGEEIYAMIFARQMDNPKHANYTELASSLCGGIVDTEGRGGGVESYNIVLGPSGD